MFVEGETTWAPQKSWADVTATGASETGVVLLFRMLHSLHPPRFSMARPRPRTSAPSLTVSLTDGTAWRLADQSPEAFTLVVFYRGLHCPVCADYNASLNDLVDAYAKRGVDLITVSMDTEERAQRAKDEWGLDRLDVGYGLTGTQARDWGLYVSEGIKDEEPALFSEPGLFLVRPDNTLYYAAVNSMPFGRPDPEALLGALDFIDQHDYPARGEVAEGAVA